MKRITTVFEVCLRARLMRAGVALLCVAGLGLSSCGGGDTTAMSPGTGGTGIVAQGPISGFGSVIVNGIRFDDTKAQVKIDGVVQPQPTQASPSQLRLGMVAGVVGVKTSAATSPTVNVTALGAADQIEIWSIAQGSVKVSDVSTTFMVAGMTLITDAGTVFDGVASADKLTNDSVVKVWGHPRSTDLTQWVVTRVEVLINVDALNTVTTGRVNVNTTITVNGLTLQSVSATLPNLHTGQLVRVSGVLAENVLTVNNITKLEVTGTTLPTTGYASLQGVVTSVLATSTTSSMRVTRLTMGAVEVDTSSATVYPSTAVIVQGTRLEVHGNWGADGVLLARKVEVKSDLQLLEVEMEGLVEQYTSLSNFIVRGQRCDASGLVNSPFNLADLLSKLPRVHIHGRKDGSIVRVTELEIVR
jgi:hypothetical protein